MGAQCLTELVTEKKLNENTGLFAKSPIRPDVCRVVTDGKYWEFGTLRNVFTKNTKNFSIDDFPGLFGGLGYVFSRRIGNLRRESRKG
uniref:Uncharacterized protein n=1 Tax=Candidatus Kentrum sp. TC TaxID=2126339 RepID=A0A451A221_9GAMM|nr:MAG: hypothetical protein BECKTC1821F_GA0114240_10409 [Candidatus Kentron sp. TC]